MISIAVIVVWHALRNDSASNSPAPGTPASSARWNLRRLSEARLHAESSRNMYSEHGLDALIGPEFEQVCQRLMVVSYCTPGSPQYQVPSAICRRRNLASCSPLLALPATTRYEGPSVSR